MGSLFLALPTRVLTGQQVIGVAKRLSDPYDPRVRWLKIKNPDYSQMEGWGDVFNGPRRS